jgi:chaperone modulatory protein CbpM
MNDEILSGLLLNDEHCLSLSELSHACDVQTEWVIELVNEGILEPQGKDIQHWQFSGISLRRVQTCVRLRRDLDLNLPGIALTLQLLDEIQGLRSHLRVMDPDFDQS